jgi:hypothetical protein
VIPRIWRAFPNNLHLKKKASNSSIKRITGKKKKKKNTLVGMLVNATKESAKLISSVFQI